ncbi:hypothetical protein K443DRAFT_131287 [Laccaria amethystina LaAM-08-1]|uniref:DUF6589 domain-containing protein n=1 Tax=Laccaria amethystina LaAM-08-1 TaxID=1095629 RepID=A0A0C9Y6F4_9AGAR|nr:hypothetical protein K443DRAFT_131287 [Laccaria amethystina LaAM-08-1]
MLQLVHNLTKVWSSEVHYIVLNNWLINPTVHPNSWLEIDLMQEHLNYWIKVFYKAHGANATWEWLEWILPCVDGRHHAPVNLTNEMHTLMESLHKNKIYQIKKECTPNNNDGPIKDVITMGLESLSEGMKNPISEYNDAFTQLQTHYKMKPVILGSLAAAINTKISITDSNAGPIIFSQTPSSATGPNSGEMCNKAHNEVENAVGYLDDAESGLQDSQIMVMVSTAANMDLDMDEVKFKDEVMDEDSEDYPKFMKSDFPQGDSLKVQPSLPPASD